MGGEWPIHFLLCGGGCFQGLVHYTLQHSRVIAIKLFSSCVLVSVDAVHPYSTIDMAPAWKKLLFSRSSLTSK